jgi:hypothetical protein
VVRRRLLPKIAIAMISSLPLLGVTSSGQAAELSCTPAQKLAHDCPIDSPPPTTTGSINGDGVDIRGSVGIPGSSGSAPGAGGGTAAGAGARGGPAAAPPPPLRDGYTVTAPITLDDLVNFTPVAGIDHMEPNGWMVVGLDTNFYATAESGVQTGLLLDLPASVRFTAVRFRWVYGDGTAATRASMGASWEASGLGEFDRTSTSHVYRSAGTYSIDLTIEFSAEYRYAGGAWTAISGTIPVAANRLVATAGEATTVLVGRDCSEHPSGPGC